MSLVDRYKMYREACRKLNSKIIENCLERDVVMEAASLLGIVEGDTIIFENEYETDLLMDFVLHDLGVAGGNAIRKYREKYGGNELELDLLDGLLSSYTSLFKITSISRAESLLFLDDILGSRGLVELMDLALSQTAKRGMLLFTRIVPLGSFNMTSGMTFAFPSYLEKQIVRNYKRMSEHIDSDSEAVKRFVSFFKLSKIHGLEVEYREKL